MQGGPVSGASRAPARGGGSPPAAAAPEAQGAPAGAVRAPAAIFIDKDGTLIDDLPYNVDPARVAFAPYALAALRRLHDAGFALIVVSNQSGLATGRFTADAFARLQRSLAARLGAEGGVELTDFLYCPHAPAPDGRPACACRKPAPGMLLDAARTHGIDLAASWMVGDILDDIEAGRRAGCRTVLLDVGNETEWRPAPAGSADRTPHHTSADWRQVAQIILARRPAGDAARAVPRAAAPAPGPT